MIFVDTSAWLAASDVRDGKHSRALGVYRTLLAGAHGRLITSDYVMDETLTLLRKRMGAKLASEFWGGLESSPSMQLVWISPEHFRQARGVFLEQGRHSWSFTDCTSFVLMRELRIQSAFAFDRDFQEAGFTVYP